MDEEAGYLESNWWRKFITELDR